MTEVNSKGREILTGPRGGKYVLGPNGKKIPVKATKVSKAKSPMVETGKVDAKKRKVFKDSKDRTYVKQGDKKVYVKKLFTPAVNSRTTKTSVNDKPSTKSNEAVRKAATIWKKKVNNRLKPLRKGKNYKPHQFEMIAPRVNMMPQTTGNFEKIYSDSRFPLQTAKGSRINSRAVIATKEENISHDQFANQTEYLKNMNLHDLMTIAAYTHFSHWWLGPHQRTGQIKINFSRFRLDMIWPLFPQMETIIDAGYNVLKTDKITQFQPYINEMVNETKLANKYAIYIAMARENVFSTEALELALKMFVNDFERIINDSPPVTNQLVVYRGTTSDILKEKKGTVYSSKQFTSTAYKVDHAVKYARGRTPTLQRITIPAGKHALFIAPVNRFGQFGEYEVVLPPCKFEITGRNRKTRVFVDGKFKFYRVTDLLMM